MQVQKRISTNEPSKTNDTAQVQTGTQPAILDIAPDADTATRSYENDGTNSTAQEHNEQIQNGNKDVSVSGIPSSQTLQNDLIAAEADLPEAVPVVTDVEAVVLASSDGLVNDKVDVNEGQHTSLSPTAEVDIVSQDPINSRDADVPSQIDQNGSQSVGVDARSASDTQSNDAESKVETVSNHRKQQEHKGDASPMKLQDQLDEVKHYHVNHILACLIWCFGFLYALNYSQMSFTSFFSWFAGSRTSEDGSFNWSVKRGKINKGKI